jgi:hypothetical protein
VSVAACARLQRAQRRWRPGVARWLHAMARRAVGVCGAHGGPAASVNTRGCVSGVTPERVGGRAARRRAQRRQQRQGPAGGALARRAAAPAQAASARGAGLREGGLQALRRRGLHGCLRRVLGARRERVPARRPGRRKRGACARTGAASHRRTRGRRPGARRRPARAPRQAR